MIVNDENFPVRTLLVVEDQSDLNDLLVELAKGAGYNVLKAFDGDEALELIETNEIHGVLCDIVMPKVSGVEVLEAVRARGKNVPFLFLTGYQNEKHLLHAVRLGASEFMEKPFHSEELLVMIERLLEVGVRIRRREMMIRSLAGQSTEALKSIEDNEAQLARFKAYNSRKRPSAI